MKPRNQWGPADELANMILNFFGVVGLVIVVFAVGVTVWHYLF